MTGRMHSILSAIKPWAIVIGIVLVFGLTESFVELVIGLL